MSRAERLFDPNPQIDRENAPTSQEVRSSFMINIRRFLPDFLASIKAQRGLPEKLKRVIIQR